jgi:hypothetical protein
VWTYEAPYAAVADIKDHLAFYPDRVDAIEVDSCPFGVSLPVEEDKTSVTEK